MAGNEVSTEVDSPADAYNAIVVGATGSRSNYDQAAAGLNVSSNGTLNANQAVDGANGSLLTRIGVTLVAPGGDAGPGPSNAGTFNALPAFSNQFQSTAGGQYQLAGTIGGGTTPVYSQDSFNGGASTAAYGNAYDNQMPYVAGPPFAASNPGANLGGTDAVISSQLAGTSFAAPLVAGAGAVVSQYGLLATSTNANSNIADIPFARNNSDALDHRVLKAILANGASKINVDGTLLTRSNGTQWTRSTTLQGAKALPPALLAQAVGPVSTQAQSGLDPQLGTGQLNLLNSLTNYAAGEQGPGAPGAAVVLPTGWDYENVPENAAQNTMYTYNFDYTGAANSAFQASLAWDDQVEIANAGAGNTFQTSGGANPVSTFARDNLTDLDLYLFQVNPNGSLAEVGWSNSDVDNLQHIYYDPTSMADGDYQLDVVAPNGSNDATPYGLAWTFVSVPEPTTAVIFVAGSVGMLMRRRRRGKI